MLARTILVTLMLLGGASAAVAAPSFNEAARLLDGKWRGEAFVLRVDAKRAQASTAPDRPFEWRRFLVKQVRDNAVVFSIGADIYEATIEADSLTLTGTSFRGAQVLVREDD